MAVGDDKKQPATNTLVSTEYITPKESALRDKAAQAAKKAIPASVSSKASSALGKKNLFDKTPSLTPGPGLEAVSAFPTDGDPGCTGKNTLPPANPDDRNITNPVTSSDCGNNINNSLTATSFLEHVTKGLSESKIVAIETMLVKEHGSVARGLRSVKPADRDGNILKGVSSVSKAMSQVGANIRDKSDLNSLLTCVNNAGLNGYLAGLILDILIAGLIAQALCIGVAMLKDTILELLSSGLNVKKGIVLGVIASFAGSKDLSSASKLALAASLPAIVGPLDEIGKSSAKLQAGSLLKSISGKPGTPIRDPNKEHANANTAMGYLDPNWDKDSNGDRDMSSTKGNEYLNELNTKKLATGAPPAGGVTTTVDNIDPDSDKYASLLVLASNVSKKEIGDGSNISVPAYSR